MTSFEMMWNFIIATIWRFVIMIDHIYIMPSWSMLDLFVSVFFTSLCVYFLTSFIKFSVSTTSSSINNDVKDTFTSLHDSLSEQRTRL
jgi:hypothetical protein